MFVHPCPSSVDPSLARFLPFLSRALPTPPPFRWRPALLPPRLAREVIYYRFGVYIGFTQLKYRGPTGEQHQHKYCISLLDAPAIFFYLCTKPGHGFFLTTSVPDLLGFFVSLKDLFRCSDIHSFSRSFKRDFFKLDIISIFLISQIDNMTIKNSSNKRSTYRTSSLYPVYRTFLRLWYCTSDKVTPGGAALAPGERSTRAEKKRGIPVAPLNGRANIFHGPTRVARHRVGSVFAISGNNDTGYHRCETSVACSRGIIHSLSLSPSHWISGRCGSLLRLAPQLQQRASRPRAAAIPQARV